MRLASFVVISGYICYLNDWLSLVSSSLAVRLVVLLDLVADGGLAFKRQLLVPSWHLIDLVMIKKFAKASFKFRIKLILLNISMRASGYCGDC